ncbi:proteasomal ATPase-associated factor 1 [Caerostris extrusa]|uniref:Proteasomal ATPase-associated factor 1 n=1 Tax=Caerostris extrusa TaxID=172846 RepID=A0AAV4N3C4_CAEEX|nr:proteasomal ATPase-associated factor 1 [Caerostris extrusa]
MCDDLMSGANSTTEALDLQAQLIQMLSSAGLVLKNGLLIAMNSRTDSRRFAVGEREIATDGKLLLLGSESGYIKGVGLQSHEQIFQHQCESAVNCCCFISSSSVAFGTQDGKVWLFDLRARQPVTIWEESNSPVLCLISVKNGVFCGRADGSSSYIAFVTDRCIQLTGPGFDPVYCMAYNGESIYTGSRDGLIRKYNVQF